MNVPPATPVKEGGRAEAQRERILCAAQRCFIGHGFHAASMANIADTAGMSPGLLYRYFENKNAIVQAIIERQLGEIRNDISKLRSSSELADSLFEVFLRWVHGDQSVMSPVLYLEMSAEAARDPQVAAALRRADAEVLTDLRAWMQRDERTGGLGLRPELAASRAVLLRCFVMGLAVGAVRMRDLDPELIKASVDGFVSGLMAV